MKQRIRYFVLLTGLTTTSAVYFLSRKQNEEREIAKAKQEFKNHLDRRLRYVLVGQKEHSQCIYTVAKSMKELPGEPPFEIEMMKREKNKRIELIKKELNKTDAIEKNGKDTHFLLCTSVTAVLSNELFSLPSILGILPEHIMKKNIVLVFTSTNTKQQITESKEILQRNDQVQDFFENSPILFVPDMPLEFVYPYTLTVSATSLSYNAYLRRFTKLKKD